MKIIFVKLSAYQCSPLPQEVFLQTGSTENGPDKTQSQILA